MVESSRAYFRWKNWSDPTSSKVFTYFNKDPKNMSRLELGGKASDIGVYPIVTTRSATKNEPESVTAKIEYDEEFGTDIFLLPLMCNLLVLIFRFTVQRKWHLDNI